MPERLTCSSCGMVLRVRPDLLGKRIKCPKCDHVFKAPLGNGANEDLIPERSTQKESSFNFFELKDDDSQPEIDVSESVTPRRQNGMEFFHGLAWFLCTAPLTIAVIAWSILLPTPERPGQAPPTVLEYVLGCVMGSIIIQALYAVYHKHVVRGSKPGCFLQLFFFGLTGVCCGLLLIIAWDFTRLIAYNVVRPPGRIWYCIGTPGFVHS